MTNTQLLKSYAPNPIGIESINTLSVFLEMIEGEGNEVLALIETVKKVCLWLTEDIGTNLRLDVDWDNYIVTKSKSSGLDRKQRFSLIMILKDLKELKDTNSSDTTNAFVSGYLLGNIHHSSLPETLVDRLHVLRLKIDTPTKRNLP